MWSGSALLATFAALVVITCSATPQRIIPLDRAEIERGSAAFVQFIAALDGGDYQGGVVLLRTADGAALSDAEERRLKVSWLKAFGPSGERVEMSATVSAANPRQRNPMSADAALDLTLTLSGRSESCPPLPITNVYAMTARIEGKWYVLQDATEAWDFNCERRQP